MLEKAVLGPSGIIGAGNQITVDRPSGAALHLLGELGRVVAGQAELERHRASERLDAEHG